jgi:hypothetical protein
MAPNKESTTATALNPNDLPFMALSLWVREPPLRCERLANTDPVETGMVGVGFV